MNECANFAGADAFEMSESGTLIGAASTALKALTRFEEPMDAAAIPSPFFHKNLSE